MSLESSGHSFSGMPRAASAGSTCAKGRRTHGIDSNTRSNCSPCTGGYTCQGNSHQAPCPVGTGTPAGRSTCADCTAGKYQNQVAQAACKSCQTGRYMNSASHRNTGCHGCQAGKYADQTGLTNCKNCAVGHFQDQTTQSSCTMCAAGRFQDDVGQTGCASACDGKNAASHCGGRGTPYAMNNFQV